MRMQGTKFPSFGKSFDTYGVMGPWLATRDEIADPDALGFSLTVNGGARQVDDTRRLILGIADLVEYAASIMTLHPGDIILSGTPPRCVGPVIAGDLMHAWIEALGAMTIPVTEGRRRTIPDDGITASLSPV